MAGWGLVGSFGRGEADNWSDLDLLVIVRDTDFGTFIDPERNRLWSSAHLLIDARRNARVGAMSVATTYLRSGLPIGADWYVYPVSMGDGPGTDIRGGVDAVPMSKRPFAQWNARRLRNEPYRDPPAEERQARLAMVLIAGRDLARRSPLADKMLQTLGAAASGDQPRTQLLALEKLVAELATDCPTWLVAAVSNYLSLVALALD